MIILTVLVLVLFKFIDVLPGEYMLVLFILMGLITLIFSKLVLTRRGVKRRVIGTIFSIIYIIILVMVIIYELNTIGFLKKLGFKNYHTENYSVIVLEDSNYQELKDLNNKSMASLSLNTDGLESAARKIENKIEVKFLEFDDVSALKNDFMNKEAESVLIENSILAILSEDDKEFKDNYRVIYEFSIDVETRDITDSVDITKDTFNIYISGIDTYGVVSSVARSDVNMVISVNPKTHQILITSIPRDYYVSLPSKNASDKLTHAGIYGIDESVLAVEELLDTNINYYIKVNFTSLINIVDTLGGVRVNSKYSFTSRDGYYYNSGYNNLNGEEALSFVRERKAFNGGDRVRIENQAAMIEALIDKAMSSKIITKYNSLLNTLGDSFVTNLDMDSLTEFVKLQVDEMPSWEVQSQSLDGTDSYQYTYSYGSAKSYVMMPNNETVINAQNKIKEVVG